MKKVEVFLLLFILITNFSCNQKKFTEKTVSEKRADKIELELKNAEIYITAKNSEKRLTKTSVKEFRDANPPEEHFPTLIVDANKTFQKVEGFGGALTDAAAETFYKLPSEKQQEIADAYFSRNRGIGYTFFRTHINSCDFSSASYAYSEVEDDKQLTHFSIAKDKKYRIPLIKKAMEMAGNDFKLLASPWSPPAWMKTNNNMLQGGKLKPEYYQTWANYYIRFIQEYEKAGIPVWGITVQNEPMAVQTWESCIYSAEEERDFVKNYLGPAFVDNNMADKKIVIWDHNRGVMYNRAATVFNDPVAAKYVWGTGFHWYTGDHFENVKQVSDAFPEKKLLFTEGCVFPFNIDKLHEWHWGERYGESVLNDLKNGASGWIDWNILLDETGGPNHVANYCYAPVIGITGKGEIRYMNSYFYMGHFSKFIKPGAKRIICSSNLDDLNAVAAVNKDGSVAVVVMNSTENDIEYRLWIDNRDIVTTSLNHSIMTIVFM